MMYYQNMIEEKKKSPLLTWLFLIFLILTALFLLYKSGRRRGISGIGEPIQTPESGHFERTIGEWKLNFDYDYAYDIEALVLHTKNYPETDIGGKLAPKDLALAWGTVAAYNNVIDFHWGQSGRWYHWYADSYQEIAPACLPGIDAETSISLQSANNHIIAADSSIKRTISRIRRGDHVHLKGYLVNISGSTSGGKSFTWNSSISRFDTGGGSCEVFFVTSAQILP